MATICRTCLSFLTKDDIFYALNGDKRAIQITKKLKFCVPEMSLEFLKESFICKTCVSDLNTAHLFKTKCLGIEDQLFKYYANLEIDISQICKNGYPSNGVHQNKDGTTSVKTTGQKRRLSDITLDHIKSDDLSGTKTFEPSVKKLTKIPCLNTNEVSLFPILKKLTFVSIQKSVTDDIFKIRKAVSNSDNYTKPSMPMPAKNDVTTILQDENDNRQPLKQANYKDSNIGKELPSKIATVSKMPNFVQEAGSQQLSDGHNDSLQLQNSNTLKVSNQSSIPEPSIKSRMVLISPTLNTKNQVQYMKNSIALKKCNNITVPREQLPINNLSLINGNRPSLEPVEYEALNCIKLEKQMQTNALKKPVNITTKNQSNALPTLVETGNNSKKYIQLKDTNQLFPKFPKGLNTLQVVSPSRLKNKQNSKTVENDQNNLKESNANKSPANLANKSDVDLLPQNTSST